MRKVFLVLSFSALLTLVACDELESGSTLSEEELTEKEQEKKEKELIKLEEKAAKEAEKEKKKELKEKEKLAKEKEKEERKKIKQEEKEAKEKEKELKKKLKEEEKERKEKEKEEEKKKKENDNPEEEKKKLTTKEKILENHNDIEDVSIKDGFASLKINGDGSFSVNSLVSSSAKSSFEAAKTAFSDKEITAMSVNVEVTLIDNKGNESKDTAINIFYRKDNFKEFDYDNFIKIATAEPWRFYNEADSYHIHPGIYRDLKDSIKGKLLYGSHKGEGQ